MSTETSGELHSPKGLDLALQGGGSHGAFTWGVLDRLLADDRIEIKAISGTSAGAMNAVVLADGMHAGGREGAQQALSHFWKAVSDASRFSPIQRTPLDRLIGRWSLDASPGYWFFDIMSRFFSPYDLNPFNINPLRTLLLNTVDFEGVRATTSPKIFIAATNVRTGQAHVFRNADLTPDVIMASACLPFLYQAVEIDGEAYWDGGYMGNPVLYPLVSETDPNDILIVQINPIYRDEIPRSAQDILNRLNEISFNASLIKELRALALVKALFDEEGLNLVKYREMYLHRIHGDAELRALSVSSKLNAEWKFLEHLHDIGWRTTEIWLEQNFDHIGSQSTLNLNDLNA